MSIPRLFRCFKTSPKIIRQAIMMYVRYPPSRWSLEGLLHERGLDNTDEVVR